MTFEELRALRRRFASRRGKSIQERYRIIKEVAKALGIDLNVASQFGLRGVTRQIEQTFDEKSEELTDQRARRLIEELNLEVGNRVEIKGGVTGPEHGRIRRFTPKGRVVVEVDEAGGKARVFHPVSIEKI